MSSTELVERIQSIQPVEHQGERVITLSQMDDLHRRPSGTAGRNFRQHRGRLLEGTHYFEIRGDEIRRPYQELYESGTKSLILLTQRGYLLLVKSFKDDRAWEVQDGLVEHYFRSIEQLPSGHLTRLHRDELVAIGKAVREGMEEFISPVRSDIRCLDVKVDEVKTQVCAVKTVVSDIESRVSDLERGKRKNLSLSTKRQHIDTVRAFYNGRCPCCEGPEVVDETFNETSIANWEHWYGRHKNHTHQTWVVCRSCNVRLETDEEFKNKKRPMFESYQQRREALVYPLFL